MRGGFSGLVATILRRLLRLFRRQFELLPPCLIAIEVLKPPSGDRLYIKDTVPGT
jgi:hypothetical protein